MVLIIIISAIYIQNIYTSSSGIYIANAKAHYSQPTTGAIEESGIS